jgi:hypothetical protein
MPRRLPIEYEGAIYHVMARGNACQDIVHDLDHRQRLLDDLDSTVGRADWELLAFVVLSNHLHLLVKTPRPNLAAGMGESRAFAAELDGDRKGNSATWQHPCFQDGTIRDCSHLSHRRFSTLLADLHHESRRPR